MLRKNVMAAACALLLLATAAPASATPVTITNATQFTDTTGAVVHAHGGGMVNAGSS
jgi:hypothetical protein